MASQNAIIIITSGNNDKINAVYDACKDICPVHIGLPVDSGIIGGQPWGYMQTEQGCANRIREVETKYGQNKHIIISIESGFVPTHDMYGDCSDVDELSDIAVIHIKLINGQGTYKGISKGRPFIRGQESDIVSFIKHFEATSTSRYTQLYTTLCAMCRYRTDPSM